MTLTLSWSGGKDSAWALERLRADGDAPRRLFTTLTEPDGEVTLHRVPRSLVAAQADAVGLPLVEMSIPVPCSNEEYARRMAAMLAGPLADTDRIAFGDLHLEDVRRFREDRLAEDGRRAVFPLWGEDTRTMARDLIAAGVRAIVCAVDTEQLDGRFLGRWLDHDLLDELPDDVDPCGENGELHTFVVDAPAFRGPVRIDVRGRRDEGRFHSLVLAPPAQPAAARSCR